MIKRRVSYGANNEKDELALLYDLDQERFRKSYFPGIETANQEQLAARLIASTHSLEKSLSNDEFEVGHGFETLRLLVGFLDCYQEKNYNKQHLAYINTLSTLKEFYEKHKGTESISEIESIFGDWLPIIKRSVSVIGGSKNIAVSSKKNNSKKNFKELAEGRYAVRTYSDRLVDKREVEEAIQIALKTPTVCNRQSVRIRAVYDKGIISKLLAVQGGMAHYKTPPVLLLVTTNDTSYIGINERNQGYIDGGLFAMSILYALEYKGLAACPLHAMFEIHRDLKVRGMLDIPDNEKIITFISVGHFKEDNSVCKSFRYPLDSVLKEVDTLNEDFIARDIDVGPGDNVQPACVDTILNQKVVHLQLFIKNFLRIMKQKTRVRTRFRELKQRLLGMTRLYQRKGADGAIVTLGGYYNYGSIIQRWALQQFLKRGGKEFVVYSTPHNEPLDNSLPDFDKYYYTAEFVKTKLNRVEFDGSDNMPIYIVGSDQVWRNWNYADERGELGYYFLNFVNNPDSKRIAYAVSFGQENLKDTKITDDFVKYAKPLIDRFDAVSTRELSANTLVKQLWGRDSSVVIDPTLLLEKKEYEELIDKSPHTLPPTKKLFSYILSPDSQKAAIVKNVQENLNINDNDITNICPRRQEVLPPVEQWLQGFRDAEFVVTDSFHGTVFSIINNTPFIVIDNAFGGTSRIKNLLSTFGLEERLIFANNKKKSLINELSPIDWSAINSRLGSLRDDSGRWLMNEVNKAKQRKRAKVVALVPYRFDKDFLDDLKKNLEGLVDEFLIQHDKDGDLMKHEGRFRGAMIEKARAMGADWVVTLDPDERFEKQAIPRLRSLVDKHLGEKVMFEFNFRELYEPNKYRIDGLWGKKRRISIFPIREDNIFTDLKIHAPKNPLNEDYRIVRTNLNIYHFKHIRPDLRKQRRDLYKKLDPNQEAQSIGYDYLTNEEGMVLEKIAKGREYTPKYRDYIIDDRIFDI